jgi:arginine utilization regulatory protein
MKQGYKMVLNCGNLKMNSVDYIVVIDKEYRILFNTRYESQVNNFNDKHVEIKYINRSFSEVYPSVDIETSSFVECLTTGEVVIRLHQTCYDFNGIPRCTNNITIPIIKDGIIMGALELAKDVTTIENISDLVNEAEASAGEVDFRQFKKIEDSKEILTNNTIMLQNIEKAKKYAKHPSPTLIYGETGTGKELFAQLMINESGLPKKSIVTQNYAAVPENLIESILFGTRKGAYTGAEHTKGLFLEADGGVLFLDELSAMPSQVQGKLLRVMQEGTFRPVGSNEEVHVDVKIIAAMNVDPVEAMNNNIIRKDLFYRFSTCMIELKPLRERVEDIEYYVVHFKNIYTELYNKKIGKIDDELMENFKSYKWEGNVRELKHLIEFMVSVCEDGALSKKHFPKYITERFESDNKSHIRDKMIISTCDPSMDYDAENFNLRDALEQKEMEIIYTVLDMCNGNKSKASEKLGIPRQTLNYKIKKAGNNDKN